MEFIQNIDILKKFIYDYLPELNTDKQGYIMKVVWYYK